MKRQRRPRKPCWFHDWEVLGLMNIFDLLYECSKCKWQRVTNPVTEVTKYFPPGSWQEKESYNG